ncbi:hypothetical protein [Microvirga massiliensis]|nr:hypothetical protein [Microvirga massiliensis]
MIAVAAAMVAVDAAFDEPAPAHWAVAAEVTYAVHALLYWRHRDA